VTKVNFLTEPYQIYIFNNDLTFFYILMINGLLIIIKILLNLIILLYIYLYLIFMLFILFLKKYKIIKL